MTFKKDYIPWNKSNNFKICPICGKRFHSAPSDNQVHCSKNCLSKSQIGKLNNDAIKVWRENGGISWNKGKKLSEKHKRKISISKLKNPTRYWLNKQRLGLRKKIKSPWREFRRQLRERTEYQQWIRYIFKRDDWTCQMCNKRGSYLHCHHIFQAKLYPEYILDTTFGITLCRKCHYKYHKSFKNDLNN